MFTWFRKWFATPEPQPAKDRSTARGSGTSGNGHPSARAEDADTAPPARRLNWNVKLYNAAHHNLYRSLIPVRFTTPIDPEQPDMELPASQAGIDIEGLDPGLADIAQEAARELQDVDKIFSHLPRQPTMLPRMRVLIRDPTSDTSDIVDLISEAPGFVARLLDLANSPYFRITQHPLADLHTAIVHLGIEGLQSLINQAVFQPILAPSATRIKGLSERIYAHALTCAGVGQHCARPEGYPPSLAHLVGLLQALDDITVLTYLTRRFTLNDDDLGRVFRLLAPRYALDITVAAVSKWEMEDELVEAVGALAHPTDDLEGFACFCSRVRAAAMLTALDKAGAVRRHNIERHLETLGFDAEALTKAH